LLSVLLLSGAAGSDAPDFSGVWLETQPDSGPPMRLQLVQTGSRVQVRISYRDTFPNFVFGMASIENETASWTDRLACVARFQWPGYNYDDPGVSKFTLSLRQPAEPGQPGPLLVYVQETHVNAPCANNHPIGIERTQKILRRR
jgi:hypothetical protein